jgi:hypothetical protein
MASDQSYTLDIQAQAERPPSAVDNAYERFDSETLGWLRANDLDGVADHIESLYAALDAAAAVDGDAQWNATLEEAAKACDTQARKWRNERQYASSQYLADGVFQERFEQAERDAAAIRSLKRLK